MDDFPGLLSGEFGLRTQGKSAPMAGSRGGSIPGRSSDSMPMPSFSSSASSNARSNRESSLLGDPMPVGQIFGASSKQDYGGGGLGDLDGIFLGGGSGSVNKRNSEAANSSASLGLHSVFDGFQDPTVKTTHLGPIFDKPVYDDDMFGGIPGLKATSTGNFDDVFASLSSASTHQHMPVQDDDILQNFNVKGQRASVPGRKHSENVSHRMPLVDDDILGNLSGKDHRSSVSERKQSADDMDKSMHSFDDLIPGFGSSPQERDYSHAKHQRSSSQSNKAETSVFDDPFVELNSKSVPAQPSSGFVMNPLDNIRASSGKTMSDISSGLFDDGNIFNGPNKVMPPFSSEVNDNQKYKTSLKTAQETSHKNPHIANESFEASINNFSDISSKKVSTGSSRKPAITQFNIPSGHLETGTSSGRFGYLSVHSNLEQPENEHSRDVEEIWLTVSEVPLFTQPTSAPAPSRPPPPFRKGQNPFTYGDKGAYSNAKFKSNAAFLFQQRTQSNVSSEPFSDSPKTFGVSSVDELEDFAMGRRQAYAYEQSETVSSEEDNETNSSAAAAAATAAALDNAEAKMKQAKELRERRESRNSKIMDFPYQVKKDKAMEDFQSQESKEKEDDFYHEQERREKEEKEKEKRRLERERERAAVEKALQEVRERAVTEARQKAERAAVEKANAEARERAARAAVQKATAEARERAAAEARERASAETKEKLAREAREKTAAIQREREAREREAKEREAREKTSAIQRERERAAVQRATQDAREREAKEREAREKTSAIQRERERAAVQRATQDARLRAERAAVEKANREARERAAAAAREKLQKSENYLDSVFGMGSRATSEPKQRASTPDVSFDTQVQNKVNSGGVRTMPSASSSGMRKTSSANFLDDLNSVFGAPQSSGEFQEIDGESEERRRARLERHQRTCERAAKALAEKNQRDMQVQMEQVERDRIAERLEIEIKRWAAGKEGNLRALLSTLQYVLWPECGWQAISLTDLITSASVKKVYRKATLHIHPDKVQQKGANLEQKIIAEKVFDLLKEAWNKFNSEELF